MQLKQLIVQKLFGKYNHTVTFPIRGEENLDPSVVLICGDNGIGKTRLLRMLNGLLDLDFSAFREVPFKSVKLTFSNGRTISVTPTRRKYNNKSINCIRVKYGTHIVDLNPTQPGALLDEESNKIKGFRRTFSADTEDISFQYISTSRLQQLYSEFETREQELRKRKRLAEVYDNEAIYTEQKYHSRRSSDVLLSDRISKFIRDAQLNYRRFFSSRNSDLFPKIIESLSEKSNRNYNAKDLIARMESVDSLDNISEHYGLFREPWDIKTLRAILSRKGDNAPDEHALTVANTYVEFLESRSAERSLLVERLETFEKVVNGFLRDKTISVNMRSGIRIEANHGGKIPEVKLSSGEYHLLFLLVTVVTTQRRGTVIAIDEPEISMHLKWQRQLMPAILKCASMAQPQVIIATHSPDITADYAKECIHLGDDAE